MKLFFNTLLILNSLSAFSQDNVISLETHFEVISTFSGSTNSGDTFHLVVAKNKNNKKFEIIPLVYNVDNFKKLKSTSFLYQPKIQSFHVNKNTATILLSKESSTIKYFVFMDLDLSTGETKLSNSISPLNFKTVLVRNNCHYLLFSKTSQIRVLKIDSTTSIKKYSFIPTQKTKDFFVDITLKPVDYINQDMHMCHGSPNQIKAYLQNEALIITIESYSNNMTAWSKFPLAKGGKVEVKYFRDENKPILKSANSFLYNNKLYQVVMEKNKGFITIFNTDTETFFTTAFDSDLISNSSKKFISLNNYFKTVNKSKKPVIFANETISGKIAFSFTTVSSGKEYFPYKWLHDQYDLNSGLFEIVIGKNNGFYTSTEELVHPIINYYEFYNKLDSMDNLKHTSGAFTETNFVYVAQNIKDQSIIVSTIPLYDLH